MAPDQNSKKEEPRGFAGLSSMASDAAIPLPASTSTRQERASVPRAAQEQAPLRATEPAQDPNPYQNPNPSGQNSAGKWLLGIGLVIGVIWLASQSNDNATPASSSPPVSSAAPVARQAEAVEVVPPIGSNNVLSAAQIQYCLSEDIRLDASKLALNNFIEADVYRFNAMVEDYNSRCSEFRYSNGAMSAAQAVVERSRSQLEAAGRDRFMRSATNGRTPNARLERPTPDATLQKVQDDLNKLGYDAGDADGLMGVKTRAAIAAFQRDHGLNVDGVVSNSLMFELSIQMTPPAASNPKPKATEYKLVPDLDSAVAAHDRGDYAAALPIFEQLANQGNVQAQNYLGSMYSSGRGVQADPQRGYYWSQRAAAGANAAPRAASRTFSAPTRQPTRDAENFKICITGEYPALCKHELLTSEEVGPVEVAESRANLRTCMTGEYPALCKHSLLTNGETAQVLEAEKRENLRTCISGEYPALCKRALLTSDETIRVNAAERAVNLKTCMTGLYRALCRHNLLSPDEARLVSAAEAREARR